VGYSRTTNGRRPYAPISLPSAYPQLSTPRTKVQVAAGDVRAPESTTARPSRAPPSHRQRLSHDNVEPVDYTTPAPDQKRRQGGGNETLDALQG